MKKLSLVCALLLTGSLSCAAFADVCPSFKFYLKQIHQHAHSVSYDGHQWLACYGHLPPVDGSHGSFVDTYITNASSPITTYGVECNYHVFYITKNFAKQPVVNQETMDMMTSSPGPVSYQGNYHRVDSMHVVCDSTNPQACLFFFSQS